MNSSQTKALDLFVSRGQLFGGDNSSSPNPPFGGRFDPVRCQPSSRLRAVRSRAISIEHDHCKSREIRTGESCHWQTIDSRRAGNKWRSLAAGVTWAVRRVGGQRPSSTRVTVGGLERHFDASHPIGLAAARLAFRMQMGQSSLRKSGHFVQVRPPFGLQLELGADANLLAINLNGSEAHCLACGAPTSVTGRAQAAEPQSCSSSSLRMRRAHGVASHNGTVDSRGHLARTAPAETDCRAQLAGPSEGRIVRVSLAH